MNGYLENIRPHLRDTIDDLKKSGEWKMHLTMKSNFMSSTDNNEKGVMCSKSDSGIVMIRNHSEEIIQKLFHFLLNKNQINL